MWRQAVGWAGLLLVALSLIAIGCRPGTNRPTLAPVAKTFVGDAACTTCHAKESTAHKASRHANTLRQVTTEALGVLAPALGPIPNTEFLLLKKGDQLAVGAADTEDALPLELALGSGKTGMTYVGMVDGGRMVELRQSYFPPKKNWYTTPGQEKDIASDDVGRLHSREDARRCVSCHAVTLPENSNIPERKFFGVGCESCHGPGSAHVAASQAANYDRDRPENLAKLTGVQMNQKCGVCHGQVEEVATKPAALQNTNRMQPYGLSKSACFVKSSGKLTCITCHNPHEDASKSPQHYVKACLSCHTPPQEKICPVNPKQDCVRCHMPSFAAIPDSDLPTQMADHWIRVHKNLRK